MTEQALQPIETEPVSVLARRVQAEPGLAAELPGPTGVTDPMRWERRLRFIFKAALLGELDDRGLVEAIPPINPQGGVESFSVLGGYLNALYHPVMQDRAASLYQTEAWQPVFNRMTGLSRAYSRSEEPALSMLTDSLTGQPGIVMRQVESLSKIALKYGAQSPEQIATILKSSGIKVSNRMATRGLGAADLMGSDLKKGDVNQVLELEDGDLRFVQDIALCPIGNNGLTVDEKDASQSYIGHEPIGCPALKNSHLIKKLMIRGIDEAERFGLLDELFDTPLEAAS